MMADKLRVAMYCRVAREDNDAIAHQESALRIYATEHGFSNVVAYVDNGESGLNYDRPALNKLNADITAGFIDTVIVHNFDRIGRDLIQTEKWISNIRNKGVTFISSIEL